MKFLKRTVLITALLGVFLLQTSCGDNKTVNTGESGARQSGTTTTTTTTVATVATTSTTAQDSWIVSQKVERTGSSSLGQDPKYLITVTVKKDRPSDSAGYCISRTDEDGDWDECIKGSSVSGLHAVQENSDGSVTYQDDTVAFRSKDEFGKYYNQKFIYRILLLGKQNKISAPFCFPDLPCK